MIIGDIKKTFFHAGENRGIYFWRDNVGNEIDCMFDREMICIYMK